MGVHNRRVIKQNNKIGNARVNVTWRSHCCRRRAISITYTECVSVALRIQNAIRMRHVFIRGLSGSMNFFFT